MRIGGKETRTRDRQATKCPYDRLQLLISIVLAHNSPPGWDGTVECRIH